MMGLSSVSTLDSSPLTSSRDVASWIKELQSADQTFYNMMTLEIWSLAQTMDEIQPGFWADYMRNRQTIVQQYLKERRRQDPRLNHPSVHRSAPSRKLSPFNGAAEKVAKEVTGTMITSFSEDLERELSNVTPRLVRPTLAKPQVAESAETNNLVIIDVFEEGESPAQVVTPRRRVVGEPAILSEATTTQVAAHPFARPAREATRKTSAAIAAHSVPTARTPAIDLVKLPHLMRFPVLRVIPALVPTSATGNLATAVVACWLTRNFLVQTPDVAGQGGLIKRCDRLTLDPGQSIVCRLGFQLKGLTSAVQVQLVASLRTQHQLTASWFEAPPSTSESGELEPPEVMVKLTNRGTEPCLLKAGQAFCRLEFLCSTH
ncbi:MAG: hypothetical protein KME12_10135 [Trichocoleus desertorum ATA4-8-CV12]|jgi:hypothetical protein|nr:hypothetical protein [Trichocoleus desertorum ATA4-8-CV12]